MTRLAVSTHRVVTHAATITLDDGLEIEFELPYDPGHIDYEYRAYSSDGRRLPILRATRLNELVILVSMLLGDSDGVSTFEWGDVEFHEFNSGHERDQWRDANVLTCADCGYDRAEHERPIDSLACGTFRPEIDFTAENGWFRVEKYAHGQVRWALTNESSRVDRQWDVAPFCAYIHVPVGPDGFTDPEGAARAWLAEYTDWCNGDIYGICHLTLLKNDYDPWWSVDPEDETCWGYIGEWNAAENMNMEHDARVKDNT